MSDTNRQAVFASKTVAPFPPVPTFEENGWPVGWLTWDATANVAAVGNSLLFVGLGRANYREFSPAEALADALSDNPAVFGWEPNVCRACAGCGHIVAMHPTEDRFHPWTCPSCGGKGVVAVKGVPR